MKKDSTKCLMAYLLVCLKFPKSVFKETNNLIKVTYSLVITLLLFQLSVSAQISGTVFRDFNNNGTRQNTSGTFVEPGAKDVIINAYNSSDALIASYVSNYLGAYSIPASGSTYNGTVGSNTGSVASGQSVRLEFVIPNSGACLTNKLYDYSSYSGSSYGSSVRFVTGNTTGVNFAINNPADYVYDASPFNSTYIYQAKQFVGNPLVTGTASSEATIFKFPFSRRGTTAPSASEKLATAAQTGSIYGVAYSKQAQRIFASAYMKRHAGFGPALSNANYAPGRIYIINPALTSTTGATRFFISLDSLGFPTHNSTGSPAYGNGTSYTVTTTSPNTVNEIDILAYPNAAAQGVIGTNSQRGLSGTAYGLSYDPAAFGQVGTVSLGDIEISDDGLFLFVTNLYDRKVYQLALNSATNPTSATYVNSWALPNPPNRSASGLLGASVTYASENANFYNGTTGYQRPFGLKYYRGKLYVGAVTTGENGGVSITDNNSGNCEYTDLWSYVYELTPSEGFSSSPVFQMPLNYFKGIDLANMDETFRPWTRQTPLRTYYATGSTETIYAQAILSDIEFDVEGSMILAFRDRFQDQAAYGNRLLVSSASDQRIQNDISGDIIRAYKNPSTCVWEREVNAKEGPSSPNAATAGQGNKQGFGDTSNVLVVTNVAVGNNAWSNLNLIRTEDASNLATTTAIASGQFSQRIKMTNLNFDLPTSLSDGATIAIRGISVRVIRKSNLANAIVDSSVRLIYNGIRSADNATGNKASGTAWPTTLTSVTYGGSTDLWGMSLTPSMVNSSTFGVTFKVKSTAAGAIPSIDHIEVMVHYRVTSTGSGSPFTDYTANSNGAKAGEFYYEDGYEKFNGGPGGTNWFSNSGEGSLALLPGSEHVVATMSAPATEGSSGISLMHNTTGANTGDYSVVIDATNISKGGALGDIELFGATPSIEVGNRVWNDADGNGVQNAGEAGIANVNLAIYADFNNDGIADGAALGTTTTNANGEWYFNNSNITDGDPITAGNQAGLKPNSIYLVQLATGVSDDWDISANGGTGGPRVGQQLVGLGITEANHQGNGETDFSDNDAIMFGGVPTISLTTGDYGENNHTYDLGFSPLASLGDYVWLDTDKDGEQDVGEKGVAGITVTLLNSSDATLSTTITDAYGYYLFSKLTVGTYKVKFTLPPNYGFSPNTNTVDNTAGTKGITVGSDPNAITGITYSIALSAGENERNIDAGIIFNSTTVTASVGDKVWFDTDADGTQDANEAGVSGITVTLYNSTGQVIATTLTNASGNYLFTNVTPANGYKVGFSLPPGMAFTSFGGSGNIAVTTNSDANTTAGSSFGLSPAFNVAASEQVTYVDAGIKAQTTTLCSVGDRVWYDNNRDGDQDAGEPGIDRVTVNLKNSSGTIIATTITDAYGYYIFNGLSAGTYSVNFVKPTGLQITSLGAITGTAPVGASDNDALNSNGNTSNFVLVAGSKNMTIDCGMYSTTAAGSVGALGDYVWFDYDLDGIQDAGETGISGVTVILYNNSGTAIDSTSTDLNGYYLFTNLAAANYSVGFTNIPNGFIFTKQDKGTDAADSDVNPATGKTVAVAVTGGATNSTLDAGLIEGTPSGLGTLGNKVWYDLDNDGIQDAGELGVAGVTVNLYNDVNNNGTLASGELTAVASVVTNSLGEYIFNGLNAGNYQVGFVLPAGLSTYTLSTKDLGSSDELDSDGNPKNTSIAGNTAGAQTSFTALIALQQGEDNLSVDLGIVPLANTNTLGNYVWFDADADGLQDASETPVSGVSITLYNSGGTNIGSTTTDKNGEYQFVGLADGIYSVGFSNLPSGFNFTTKSVSNTTNGSDADANSGLTTTVLLNSGNRNDRTLDAGLISTTASLGNLVWNDIDGDGIQEAGELGIPGVSVNLYSSDGVTLVSNTITNETGYYNFINLNAGTYIVGFTTVPGLNFTTKDANAENLGTDSDADLVTAKTGSIVLQASESNMNVDAGLTAPQPASIGNRVWSDLNNNSVQDAGEIGVSGVLVTLYNSSNQAISSAITNGDGLWKMTDVTPGTGYYLIFTSNIQNFNLTTTPNGNPQWSTGSAADGNNVLSSGSESDTDSDVGRTNGTTGTFTIVAGNNFVNMDAGISNAGGIIPLPVSWLKFNATLVNNDEDVFLDWSTGSEINNDYFEVQRSYDAKTFTTISIVDSKAKNGNSSTITNYDLTDVAVDKTVNTIYYRIKQVDFDGKYEYTDIRFVSFTKTREIKLYPNPASNQTTIFISNNKLGAKITVLSMDGRILKTDTMNLDNYTLNLEDFAQGTYLVQIESNSNQELFKLIKK